MKNALYILKKALKRHQTAKQPIAIELLLAEGMSQAVSQ